MKKHLAGVLAALALWGAGSCPGARGQTLNGNITPPPVSPYINVLRGGAPAGVNFYNIVQPQLQFYSAINQLQAQQQLQEAAALNPSGALTTGHPILFNNYSHFYYPPGLGTGGLTSPGLTGFQNVQSRVRQVAPTR